MKMRIMALAFLAVVLLPQVCPAAEVVDAVMCLKVENRQPVDAGTSFPADVGQVWCWSRIKDADGTAIKHVYYHNDKEKASVELKIGSPLFRTFSSKRILPGWTGKWRVDIVDASGAVMKSLDFTIGEAAEPTEGKAAPGEAAKPSAEGKTEESAPTQK
ncbi:DUF2914 domain-containing protein [Candidatus Poribacteria bacterium]|nr:DUF2914 domain-containing protein [Candidatus Poribacteria bacterium]